jgi:TetR/AcrR family transcriptional repressor of nem operon
MGGRLRDDSAVTRSQAGRDAGTAQRILDVAERLVQLRGFNAFSYADVANELGVTKPSVHYHYPGKGELGEALIKRYAGRFGDALAAIDAADTDIHAKLAAYSELYAGVLRDDRMCLCGMLAADYATLPAPMRDAVVRFFDLNEAWLGRVLEDGRTEGTVQFAGSARTEARLIIGALEGAMLVARPYGEPERFEAAAKRLLATLSAPVQDGLPAA